MINNNRLIVDLSKVQYANFYYTNQYGVRRVVRPTTATVRGEYINDKGFALFHPDYPKETCIDRAVRLGIVDRWIPTCLLKLQANCCLIYTGDKAISIYKAFCERQFNKPKSKKG